MPLIPPGTKKQFNGREYELRDHRWRRVSDGQDIRSGFKPLNFDAEVAKIEKATERQAEKLARKYENLAWEADHLGLEKDRDDHDALATIAQERQSHLETKRIEDEDAEDAKNYYPEYFSLHTIRRNDKGHIEIIYNRPDFQHDHILGEGNTETYSPRSRTIGQSKAGEWLIVDSGQTSTLIDAAGKIIRRDPEFKEPVIRPAPQELINLVKDSKLPRNGEELERLMELAQNPLEWLFAAQPQDDPDRLNMQEAINYLAQKLNLDTDSWIEGQGIVQLSNFTVAAAKGALLQDVKDTLDRSIDAGESMQDFLDRFSKVTARWVGRNAWRGELIYSQNIRQAHGLGRWQQMQETATDRPFLTWRHGGSSDPRPEHKAMDGKVFRIEDVTVPLPSGFGCRCQYFSLSPRELDRSGKTLSEFSMEPDEGFLYRSDLEDKIADLKVDQVLKKAIKKDLL
jgi:SPP1 gp7 family putative phage head morphogenesis protein